MKRRSLAIRMVRSSIPYSLPILSLLALIPPVLAAEGGDEGRATGAASLSTSATISGDSLDLSAYRGKVVYLDFWASWCGPCRAAFPWMDEMQRRYGSKGFTVLAVSVDRKREAAEKFLKERSPSFPILFDPEGKVASRYDLKGMPTSFLYDRQGRLHESHLGFDPARSGEVEAAIAKLLAEEAPKDANP
ncbi:MAG: TlpA disulfide reductase family protein [Candidatus Eisenbacteria bacterium]|nr:TlpA disulfide reductase family protein [Candidatus Eisenbacteria bacterium]